MEKIFYGYRRNKKGRVIIYEPEARIIRAIYLMALYGLKEEQIIVILNMMHINPPTNQPLLNQPSTYDATEYPSIIPEEVFDEVQRKLYG